MNRDEQVRPDPGLALLSLYDTALPEVYGYLLARCGRTALAEDLTAETFLAAVQECRRTDVDPTTGWLVGIARHKLADHWRALAREERGLHAVAASSEEPQADPWDEEVDALLAREVLGEQSPLHRAALTLRYLDGLPVGEVSRVLGRTERATESVLARARTAFRHTYLRRTGGDPA
ncbi:RNA polymerase sigma24 factor [Pseudonocardia sulfidoxydans NBRC 16205]|uniref:RNA polymerase sigma24 factor n=1 Tax=Pseudonocardia sulfidoxydans NBRC 16205 TaxID=1223511 RepID=A0A511DQ34_9PSEU|nr:RNA polymerase sigma factor [Pseudonocardia sulfidoxydans]GEL26952.1 RNA polymerase sigma24 factor [Pseudonocardia sulfidoxydans NBRC 16205]